MWAYRKTGENYSRNNSAKSDYYLYMHPVFKIKKREEETQISKLYDLPLDIYSKKILHLLTQYDQKDLQIQGEM
jgi:hypothetical protein